MHYTKDNTSLIIACLENLEVASKVLLYFAFISIHAAIELIKNYNRIYIQEHVA